VHESVEPQKKRNPNPLRSETVPDANSTIARYDNGAIAFHWTMAVLIVAVGVLGLLHDSWSKGTQAFWISLWSQKNESRRQLIATAETPAHLETERLRGVAL
jgi:hypothetical protein